jgi:hypothetical protein
MRKETRLHLSTSSRDENCLLRQKLTISRLYGIWKLSDRENLINFSSVVFDFEVMIVAIIIKALERDRANGVPNYFVGKASKKMQRSIVSIRKRRCQNR